MKKSVFIVMIICCIFGCSNNDAEKSVTREDVDLGDTDTSVGSGSETAAMEAALSNVRAVAVSVDSHSATHFETACEVALQVIDKSMNELTPDTILNINAPDLPPEEVKGIRYTALGNRFYIDKFIPVESEEGDSYMLDGAPLDLNDIEEKYDVTATWDNYVSITPLQFDYTAYDMIEKVASWGLKLEKEETARASGSARENMPE